MKKRKRQNDHWAKRETRRKQEKQLWVKKKSEGHRKFWRKKKSKRSKKMGACATKKQAINPGSALDRVISQASSDDCVLYRLADYKKGEKNVCEFCFFYSERFFIGFCIYTLLFQTFNSNPFLIPHFRCFLKVFVWTSSLRPFFRPLFNSFFRFTSHLHCLSFSLA